MKTISERKLNQIIVTSTSSTRQSMPKWLGKEGWESMNLKGTDEETNPDLQVPSQVLYHETWSKAFAYFILDQSLWPPRWFLGQCLDSRLTVREVILGGFEFWFHKLRLCQKVVNHTKPFLNKFGYQIWNRISRLRDIKPSRKNPIFIISNLLNCWFHRFIKVYLSSGC